MPAAKLVEVVTLIKRRRVRAAAQRRSVSQRVMRVAAGMLAVVSVSAAILALVALPAYVYLMQGLPSVETLESLMDPQTGALLQPTRFVDRSGQQLLWSLEPPGGLRAFVSPADNATLAAAFVASQEPLFWTGGGYSLLGLEGGPRGIAEKMVARLLLAAEPDGWMKTLRSRILAGEAIARYGRQQILNWAMNSTNFGHWTFGVEGAAQLYFGKPAGGVSLAEAALLAAVAQAPALNPVDAPALAIEYQRLVLESMRTQDLISDAELAAALAKPLDFSIGGSSPIRLASSLTELALDQLVAEWGEDRVRLGGLTVVTTLDYTLQQELETILGSRGANLAVLNPGSGQILALIGQARDVHPINNARLPFTYLNIFALGKAPASLVWDLPDPARFLATGFQGPITMRQALSTARLSPIEAVTRQSGEARANELFSAIGIVEDEASAVQIATAYAMLSNGGIQAGRSSNGVLQPSAILFVGDAQDRVALNWTNPELQAIVSPELSYLVTDVLADASVRIRPVPETITARRPMAVFQSSEWQIAFSAQRAVVLWNESGADEDAQLSSILEAAHRGLPVKQWAAPAGLVSAIVCVPSGLLPDEDCPSTRREAFLRGTEPREMDSLFQRIAINVPSGTLATVFTPEEFVEERLFLVVPPEAEAWARAAGIERPPEEFDTISASEQQSGPLVIAQPAPFSVVNGLVDIIGVLAEEAVAVDIQVGKGLRPEKWLLLGEQKATGRAKAEAEWDTTGLSGLWAIQLQAWDEGGILRRAYVIVTIED